MKTTINTIKYTFLSIFLLVGVFGVTNIASADASLNTHNEFEKTLTAAIVDECPTCETWASSVDAYPGETLALNITIDNNEDFPNAETAENVTVKLTPKESKNKNQHVFEVRLDADNLSTTSVKRDTVKIYSVIPTDLTYKAGSQTRVLNPYNINGDEIHTRITSENNIFTTGLNLGDIQVGAENAVSIVLHFNVEGDCTGSCSGNDSNDPWKDYDSKFGNGNTITDIDNYDFSRIDYDWNYNDNDTWTYNNNQDYNYSWDLDYTEDNDGTDIDITGDNSCLFNCNNNIDNSMDISDSFNSYYSMDTTYNLEDVHVDGDLSFKNSGSNGCVGDECDYQSDDFEDTNGNIYTGTKKSNYIAASDYEYDPTPIVVPNPPVVVPPAACAAPLPQVLTLTATDIGKTSATLSAAYNGRGVNVTRIYFEYGKTSSLGSVTDTVNLNNPKGIAIQRAGSLSGSTTYYYRAVAVNCAGISKGAIKTFTTGKITYTKTNTKKTTVKKSCDCNDVELKEMLVGEMASTYLWLEIDNMTESIFSSTKEVIYNVLWRNLNDKGSLFKTEIKVELPPEYQITGLTAGRYDVDTHSVMIPVGTLAINQEGGMQIKMQPKDTLVNGDIIIATALATFDVSLTGTRGDAIDFDTDNYTDLQFTGTNTDKESNGISLISILIIILILTGIVAMIAWIVKSTSGTRSGYTLPSDVKTEDNGLNPSYSTYRPESR